MNFAALTEPTPATLALVDIDPPDLVMREAMTDEGLTSLTDSIRVVGLLQNLVVVVNGVRFRIAAGHRRFVALGLAEKTHAHCLVFPEGTPLEEAAKVAENTERESVNPAAEATYYLQIYNGRADKDVERVAAIANRKLSHVLDRLDLTRGYDFVLEALRDPSTRKSDSALALVFPETDLTTVGQITLAVAGELNKVHDVSAARLFTHDAMKQGANSKTVRRWREETNRLQRIQEAMAANAENPTPASTASPIVNVDACPLCHSDRDQHEMEYVKVHRSCRAVFSRQQGAGESEGAR